MVTFGSSQLQELLPSKRKLVVTFKSFPNIKPDILSAFSEIRRRYEYACILESSVGADRLAELSIVVFDPSYLLTATDGRTKIEDLRNSTEVESDEDDPLRAVQMLVESFPTIKNQFRFAGGAVGYISFDAIRYWEKTALSGRKAWKFGAKTYPDLRFGLYRTGDCHRSCQSESVLFSFRQSKGESLCRTEGYPAEIKQDEISFRDHG